MNRVNKLVQESLVSLKGYEGIRCTGSVEATRRFFEPIMEEDKIIKSKIDRSVVVVSFLVYSELDNQYSRMSKVIDLNKSSWEDDYKVLEKCFKRYCEGKQLLVEYGKVVESSTKEIIDRPYDNFKEKNVALMTYMEFNKPDEYRLLNSIDIMINATSDYLYDFALVNDIKISNVENNLAFSIF